MSWWKRSEDSPAPATLASGLEITEEEANKIIERLATRIIQHKMEVPATILLEVCRPLTFFAGQAVLVAGPILYPFFGMENVERLAGFLNNRENIARLIARLEQLSEKGSS
jgi:hypothetical protein